MSSGGFLASGSSAMISIWLLTWGIRRQGELDHDLDLVARRLRWLMVVAGVIVAVAATRPAFNSARGVGGMARGNRISGVAKLRLLLSASSPPAPTYAVAALGAQPPGIMQGTICRLCLRYSRKSLSVVRMIGSPHLSVIRTRQASAKLMGTSAYFAISLTTGWTFSANAKASSNARRWSSAPRLSAPPGPKR